MQVPENTPPIPSVPPQSDAPPSNPIVKSDWRSHIVTQIILYLTGAMVIVVIVQRILACRAADPMDMHNHKVMACAQMPPPLHAPLERIQQTVDPYIFHRVVQAHSDEVQMITDIFDTVNSCHDRVEEVVHEVLNGAYLLIPDGGALYTKWKDKLSTARERSSSHHSTVPQLAVAGTFIGEGLFGQGFKELDAGKILKYSWVQLEAYPTFWKTVLPHMYSYVKYLMTGRNQGPYGSSLKTEHNPLHLPVQQDEIPSL